MSVWVNWNICTLLVEQNGDTTVENSLLVPQRETQHYLLTQQFHRHWEALAHNAHREPHP